MEFEQNGRTYGKTMEFSFWWKKLHAFLKKKMGGGGGGGGMCPDLKNVV